MIVNAAHAISDVVGDGGKGKGKIRVRTRSDGEWAIVEISDTGSGMPPHVQQRIFDPFFTTKEVGKGTGQGLAIAHNVIVDKHGGTIKVTSAPGAGTTFIIRLPIGGIEVRSRSRGGGRCLNAIRVIFVDDEPRVLEGLKRMLRPKRNEWQMTFVGSAQAALDALKAEPCEVVVTDMRMPGMNGAELLEVVQREYPGHHPPDPLGPGRNRIGHEGARRLAPVPLQALRRGNPAGHHQPRVRAARSRRQRAVKTLVARINKLPTLPATYQKLVECLQEPELRTSTTSRSIISTDPSMTARLLKVVNSAYFGLAKPVADVARAGALLGLDRIMALVLGQGIFSGCDPPKVRGFSLDALWTHSVATATAAHRIAIDEHLDKRPGGRRVSRRHAARHRQAGARHGHAGAIRAACSSWRGDRPGELQQIEMLELQAAHTDVGAYLVGLWGLPNTIAEAIAYHEDPAQSTDPSSACRASCTSPTASRITRTSPTARRPNSA